MSPIQRWLENEPGLSTLLPLLGLSLMGFGLALLMLLSWPPYTAVGRLVHAALMNPALRRVLGVSILLSLVPAYRRHLLRLYRLQAVRDCRRSESIAASIQVGQLDPWMLFTELHQQRRAIVSGSLGTGEGSYLTTVFCEFAQHGPRSYVPVLLRASPGDVPLDRVRHELRRGWLTDSGLVDLLLRKGPLLFLIDGLDELTDAEVSLWFEFGDAWARRNLFCFALSRPIGKLSLRLIEVPRVAPERVLELIERELRETPRFAVFDYPPDVLRLLGSPALLATFLKHLRSTAEGDEPVPKGRIEVLEFLLRDASEPWATEESPMLLLNAVCEAAFRSIVHGTNAFESRSVPAHMEEELIRAGLLVRRGASRIEYGHPLLRSFLAARYFAPRWSRLLDIEGRDLDPTSATGMLELAIETVTPDLVEQLTWTIASLNPLVGSALLETLEGAGPRHQNLQRAMLLLKERRLEASEKAPSAFPIGQDPWTRWFSERKPDSQLFEKLSRPGPGYPAIRVSRLRLHNIKCFAELDYDFRLAQLVPDRAAATRSENGTTRRVTVMVGENATGKSTILQAVALGCLGPAMANQTEGFRARTLLRRGADAGAIELELDLITDLGSESETRKQVIHVGMGLQATEEDFYALTDREMVLGTRNHAEHVDALRRRVGFQWGLCVGYGAYRALKEPEQGPSQSSTLKAAAERVLSMFVRSTTLMHPEALERLLYEGDASGFSTDAPRVSRRRRKEIVQRISQAIPGLEARAEQHQLRLVEKLRDISDLAQLSDGPNSMVALLAHLTRHALEVTGWHESPFEVRGVALIDEVDLHLHPTWQRKVLSKLSDTFPNMQFIATTHSPLVLGGIPDGQVHLLRQRPDGSVNLIRDLPSVKGWEADQILTSLLFGVSNTYDVETEQMLSEYIELMGKPGNLQRMSQLDRLLQKRRPRDSEVTELDTEVWRLFLDFARQRMANLPERERHDFAEAILSTLGSEDTSR